MYIISLTLKNFPHEFKYILNFVHKKLKKK